MHKYLYNYEDFLLIDDDYIARAGSSVVRGPQRGPRYGNRHNGEEDDSDSFDDEHDDYYDIDEDEDYGDYEDRFDREFR